MVEFTGDVLNRRSFLDRLAGIGVLGMGGGGLGLAAPLWQPVSGGPRLERIGIQLYSVRRDLKHDFEGTLARIASIGYSEVEFAGYFDRNPELVKEILARHGLAAP